MLTRAEPSEGDDPVLRQFLVIHGWTVFARPRLLAQSVALAQLVEARAEGHRLQRFAAGITP